MAPGWAVTAQLEEDMMMMLVRSFVFLSVLTAAAYAQSDPFQGTWILNTAVSKSLNPMPKAETMLIEVSGTTERSTADFTPADGPVRKSEYRAARNDGQWHPVTNLETGRESGKVMVVTLDERTVVRLYQRTTGRSLAILRVPHDGKTLRWTTIQANGMISGDYTFDRK